jgi:hypothetical protein
MKKLMMIVAFAALTAGAQAQDKARMTPEQRAQMQTGRMTTELKLNTEQAAKVETINLKFAEQAEALRAEREAAREAMHKEGKGQAMRDAHEAELKGVLTEEQFAKWKAKREEMKAKQVKRRTEMRDGRRKK